MQFTFMEKILKNDLFCFIEKNSPYLLNDPHMISGGRLIFFFKYIDVCFNFTVVEDQS